MGESSHGPEDGGMTDDTPPPAAVSEPPRPTRPPLERSRDRRVVAGVCGGLGRHLDIDPVVFRVVIAVLCLSGGVGLFIYGLAWLIVPVESTGRNELQRLLSGRVDGQSLGAVLVTVLGTGIFFSYMGSSGHIFPLLLIALLAFAALRYDPAKHPRRRGQLPLPGDPGDVEPGSSSGFQGTIFGVTFSTAPSAPPQQPTVPVPPAAPSWWQRPDPLLKDTAVTDSAVRESAAEGSGDAGDAGWQDPLLKSPLLTDGPQDAAPVSDPGRTTPPPWTPYAPPAQPSGSAPRREPRQRSFLGSAFFFLALITGGGMWWVAAKQHHSVNVLAVLASALLVLGLGLIVCSIWGRGRSLAVWATLLTLGVVAVGASPVQLHTSYQHQVWAPVAAGTLQPSYDLGTGDATLDLSKLATAPGQTVSSDVHLGVGRLRVILPPGVEVRIGAHVGVGSMHFPDDGRSGGLSESRNADLNPGAAATHGLIDLKLNIGAGDLEVTQ